MDKYEMKIYQDVFYFKYYEMATTAKEARQQAEEVKKWLGQPQIKKFLNDNSNIKTVANPEVNEVWGELMAWVGKNVEKNATVAPNTALKMQLNRLSRTAGTIHKIKAFTTVEEAMKFLEVPEMKL
jgi:biotin carboxyl carrier protein